MRDHYSGDPYWLTAKYPGTCVKCAAEVHKGDRIWHYPAKGYSRNGRSYCEPCGAPMAREFESAAEDEWLMSQGFRGGY